MKGSLRESDEVVAKALGGRNADVTAIYSFQMSDKAWVVLLYGEAIMAFGVRRATVMDPVGAPWFVATEKLDQVKIEVIRKSKGFVKQMKDEVGSLETLVHHENIVSKKWLMWCGFEYCGLRTFGDNQDLFYVMKIN